MFGVVDYDREVFLALLERTVFRYGWNLHAYCLMGNHFHLVLDTPGANIAAGMRDLKSSYATWFNDGRPRTGALFERRYFDELLDVEAHLFETTRYVVLNPVRAGLCRRPEDWVWSSYRAMIGLVAKPRFLCLDLLHGMFGGSAKAPVRYARFVADALAPRRRGMAR